MSGSRSSAMARWPAPPAPRSASAARSTPWGSPARGAGGGAGRSTATTARTEKTFALADGAIPPYIVGLSIERDPECEGANGVLIEITEAEADRLDLRELRYDRVDVTGEVRALDGSGHGFEQVILYTAKPEHHAPRAPDGAIVIANYVRTVEAAFAELGPGAGRAIRRDRPTRPPVIPVDATAGPRRDPGRQPARLVAPSPASRPAPSRAARAGPARAPVPFSVSA